MARVRSFCMTVNNYEEGAIDTLRGLTIIKYAIIGKEVGDTGTPHLQCYVQLMKVQTIRAFQKKLTEAGVHCHLEVAKGSLEKNQDYCKKEGRWIEWGTPSTQGKRTDIAALYEAVVEGKTNLELGQEFPAEYMKYYKACDRVRGDVRKKKGEDDLKESYEGCVFRPWQKTALEILREQTSRQVYWVVDIKGNTGKSWFAGWLASHCKAIVYSNGKTADIAYAYNYEPIVVFDYTRQKQEFMNYGVIESFKNGRMFSPKYESGFKVFPPPAVLVLSNWEPDLKAMSEDRWVIVRLRSL